MLDRYCWGQATRISQEAPVPVVLVKRSTHVPGGAANVARNVLSLRGKVSVFGCVADDEDGRILVSLLKDGGADTTGVYEVEGGHTTDIGRAPRRLPRSFVARFSRSWRLP